MSLVNQDQLKKIIARFEQAWCNSERPWIAEFVVADNPPLNEKILEALIPIDIEHRRKKGEKPRPGDYLQLGPEAVSFAFQELHELFENINSNNDFDATFGDAKGPTDKGERKDGSEFLGDKHSETSGVIDESDMPTLVPDGKESSFIGRYKLLRKIGEGGMGAVWLAEQFEPVQRRVAIKLIRADLGTKETIARFEAERQAIAMMDHQNIATILDAGTTESGNPYFVMELVNGIPFNDYCDQKQLTITERLELMIPVCRAIQHAHQKGIIHRDLKHSNVLVTQYDGKPVPKVIDFGLAKAFQSGNKLTDKTMFTEFGKVVGTLQYMSPEQAEMNHVDVDTRSDIYSLGVMTYKLLTGSTPLVNKTITSHSLMQLLELIRVGEAPRPAARIASLPPEKLATIAAKRNATPEKLKSEVAGDLDWIVMKALEKERDRRYETANGLALDIERYLANEEVRARPPTALYRMQKFYKRNHRLVVSVIALSLTLLLGTIGTSVGLYLAVNERNRANEESTKNIKLAKQEKLAAAEASRSKNLALKARALAEAQLNAIRIKSSWAAWQLGNVEPAWKMLNELKEEDIGWESQFLRTEFSASQQTLFGHAFYVLSIDTSSNGQWVATSSNDNTIRIWDANSGELKHICETEDSPSQVRFSPDSTIVGCVDRSNRITFWDTLTGEVSRVFGPYADDLTSIEFVEDGKSIIVGSAGKDTQGLTSVQIESASSPTIVPTVRVIATTDGNLIAELKGHTGVITDVDVTSDGEMLISCGLDNTIQFWQRQADDFVLARKLEAHSPGVLNLAISPSGKILASCGKDSQIRLWDMESGDFIKSYAQHSGEVSSVRFSSDGKRLVSASADKTAKIWTLEGDNEVAVVDCKGHFEYVSEAVFSADDFRIFTASHDHTIRIWNSNHNPSTFYLKPHDDIVWGADFSQDDSLLVSASQSGSICISDVRTGQIIKMIENGTGVLSLKHSPNSNVFVAGDDQGKLHVMSSIDGTEMKTIDAHAGYVWDVCYSADGKWLASCGTDRKFCIWNTGSWTRVHSIEAHEKAIASVRFSKNGRFILTAGDDHLIKLWDVDSMELVGVFEGHQTSVWRAIFSSSGDFIVSSTAGGEIIIWETETRMPIHRIDAHQNEIAGLTLTTDDRRLISGSDDKSIKVWDIETGIEVFSLHDQGDSEIVHASFSRDGMKLATGNRGGLTIRTGNDFELDFQMLLPQDSEKLTTQGMAVVVSKLATNAQIQHELETAKKICDHYPSADSLTILGIAHYRLDHYAESVVALTNAQRLYRIKNPDPSIPPVVEGYLALSLLKNGQVVLAEKIRETFDSKSKQPLVIENVINKELVDEVKTVFGNLLQSSEK